LAVGNDSNCTSTAHEGDYMLSTLCSHSLLAVTWSKLPKFASRAHLDDVGTPLGSAMVLKCHQTLWIARPLGLFVRCDRGTLWLVFDGDPEDVVLEPGKELVCRRVAKLSIHAMTSASVRFDQGH
jgi:hypothetical protein